MENGRSDDEIPPDIIRELGQVTAYRKKGDEYLALVEQRGNEEITKVEAPRLPMPSQSDLEVEGPGGFRLKATDLSPAHLAALALVLLGAAFLVAVSMGWAPWS